MAVYTHRQKRIILPQWKGYKTALHNGDLSEEGYNQSKKRSVDFTTNSGEDWKKEENFLNAISLINDSLISGKYDEAKTAAIYLQRHKNNLSDALLLGINKILGIDHINSENRIIIASELSSIKNEVGSKIRECRKSLNFNIESPLVWVDISRWFLIIGKFVEAERAIKVALKLSPNNRFVLRSAINFYVWKDEFLNRTDRHNVDIALSLLSKRPETKNDPWLLSAEIGLNMLINKNSKNINKAIEIINSNNFSSKSISELSSAVGTVELNHGKAKKSLLLFEKSLIDPNDNSVAQADWASEHIKLPINYKKVDSDEANTFHEFRIGNYNSAYENAIKWFIKYPYLEDPCILASYIAGSLLDDNRKALEICEYGLVTNPHNFTLLNNKVYFSLVEDKIDEAIKTFKKININHLNDRHKVIWLATYGMLCYKFDEIEYGRQSYEQAKSLAENIFDYKLAFLVKIYKIRAEFLTGLNTLPALETIEILRKEASQFNSPEILKTIDNLEARILNGNSKLILLD